MVVQPLCSLDLPLLCDEEVTQATGNFSAMPEGLQEACLRFRSLLFGSRRQLRHSLKHVPLPLTHCDNCQRCTGRKALDFAELAYAKEKNRGGGLERIDGAVFSALCGHGPPFCCDVAWQSLELLETYARHDKLRRVLEAPWNPGSSSTYSYVGSSLRLLPGPPLDLITEAWQKSFGYDSKPFLEMHEALRSLLGSTVTSRRLRLLGSAGPLQATFVAASCEITDFSPAVPYQEELHVCILGQLSLSFLNGQGESMETVVLPSRQSVLATVPCCEKGSTPVISGKQCYVKRCFEERPNEIHVLRTSGQELECSLLSQDPSGRKQRRLLLMLSEGTGQLLVRDAQLEAARKKTASSKKQRKFFVPLLPWLFRKVMDLDSVLTLQRCREDLSGRVLEALLLDFSSCRLDEAFVSRFLDGQNSVPEQEEQLLVSSCVSASFFC
jgi:hypothetical protein